MIDQYIIIFVFKLGAYSSSIVRAENVGSFLLHCKGDFGVSGVCFWINLYLPSDGNSDIEIYCYGESCQYFRFYVNDGMKEVSKGINLISYCQCPKNDYFDCTGSWYFYCGADYTNYATFGPTFGYGIDCGSYGNECGCEDMNDNLGNNYIDIDDEYDVDCCDYIWWGWDTVCPYDIESEDTDTDNTDSGYGFSKSSFLIIINFVFFIIIKSFDCICM